MSLQDGYQLVRAEQLLAALSALNDRRIGYRTFRTYLGCLELVARREAAERSRSKVEPSQRRYLRTELQTLLDETEGRNVAADLRSLARAELLTFEEKQITFGGCRTRSDTMLALAEKRGIRRLVPVPRQILKFLARCGRPALAKTIVAYLLRGLSLDRTGSLRNKGAVKVSWISELCRISERAARGARAELIRMGWITKDSASVQRKLNRDGAYFVINTAWGRSSEQSAPLPARKPPESAPPRERQETPSDLKDQKPAPRQGTGVRGTESKPDLRDIRLEDLRRLSRVRELFRQATDAGWIERGEAAFLNFTAAAVRATRSGGDPVRIFVGIVRGRLWRNITQEQETRAAEVIRRDAERRTRGLVVESASRRIDIGGLLRSMS